MPYVWCHSYRQWIGYNIPVANPLNVDPQTCLERPKSRVNGRHHHKFSKQDVARELAASFYFLEEHQPVLKVKRLIDVFTSVLKYLALVTETEYLLSSLNSQDVNDIIISIKLNSVYKRNCF